MVDARPPQTNRERPTEGAGFYRASAQLVSGGRPVAIRSTPKTTKKTTKRTIPTIEPNAALASGLTVPVIDVVLAEGHMRRLRRTTSRTHAAQVSSL